MTFDRWPQPETLRAAPDYTIGQLQAAMAEGQILTGQAVHCDTALNLHIRLGALSGIMPRGECVAPFLSGAQREIAVLSCVGRGVCCRVTGQRTAPNGDTELLLSRRLAQEEAMDYIEAHAEPGLVIPAQITHLAPFGAFADIGCGGSSRSCRRLTARRGASPSATRSCWEHGSKTPRTSAPATP